MKKAILSVFGAICLLACGIALLYVCAACGEPLLAVIAALFIFTAYLPICSLLESTNLPEKFVEFVNEEEGGEQ